MGDSELNKRKSKARAGEQIKIVSKRAGVMDYIQVGFTDRNI